MAQELNFQDVKQLMRKDDLIKMKLKMGVQLRIWKAIQNLRMNDQDKDALPIMN